MALYALMFLIPLSGLALVLVSGEDWDVWGREWEAPLEIVDDDILLAGHISTHLLFAAAFALHLGLVLKHQFVDRDHLLQRML
jgi:cytochrome b561